MDVVAKIQTRRRAQTSVREGRGGRIFTRPFRSGIALDERLRIFAVSGCPSLCLIVAALATDFAEK